MPLSDIFGDSSTPISVYRTRTISNLPIEFDANDVDARLQALQENIQFLSTVLETARVGSALIGFNATVEAGIAVGQPVYYDPDAAVFKLSQLTIANTGGRLVAGPSSEAWGLVIKKCAVDKAHLLLDGVAAVDLTASTGYAKPAGKFYLSRTIGHLDTVPDNQLICPVLLGTGEGDVLFRPFFADLFPRFVEKSIPLKTTIAGTLVVGGSTSQITLPDPTVAGWLPATHVMFGGNRPAGAFFGYNWSVDPNLADVWPPVWPEDTDLLIDSGGSLSKGYHIVSGQDSQRLIINEHGIWWMSACNGQLPWDFAADGAVGQSTCPKSLPRRLRLRGQFAATLATSSSNVIRLRSTVPWLQFVRRNTTQIAATGDLDLNLLPEEWVVATPPDLAGLALKRLLDGRFTQGPVVTSVKAGSSSVSVIGGDLLESGASAGELEIRVSASKDFNLLVSRTQLFGATTEAFGSSMAIGLRSGILNSFVHEYHVPTTIPANTDLRFEVTLLAPATLVLPAGMTLATTQLPAATSVGQAIPAEIVRTFTYGAGGTLQAGKYLLGLSSVFKVAGGETVYLRCVRHGETDGVGGEIHVLKVIGVFV